MRWIVPRDGRPSGQLTAPQVQRAVSKAVPGALRESAVGVGVDIVDIVEFQHNVRLGGDRWLGRLFTAEELLFCAGRADQLASRFAAKEAVAKVLKTGFRGVGGRDIEILTAPEGQPHVVLHGEAASVADAMGLESILVSISREGACAAAVAVGIHLALDKQEVSSD